MGWSSSRCASTVSTPKKEARAGKWSQGKIGWAQAPKSKNPRKGQGLDSPNRRWGDPCAPQEKSWGRLSVGMVVIRVSKRAHREQVGGDQNSENVG